MIGSQKMEQLARSVILFSESDNWLDAVDEWEILDCVEDLSCSTVCTCGHEGLRYLFTIYNVVNGNRLFPIGSTCIKKFNRSDLNEEVNIREKLFKLLHKIENNMYISFTSDLFSRKLLKWLYDRGAFHTAYNNYVGYYDYQFMLKMFNKRNKQSITLGQDKKIKAILLNSIKPFLQNMLRGKIV